MDTKTIEEQQEELELKLKYEKLNSFKAELKALMNKYNIETEGYDNYNGMEEYSGTDYYFFVDGCPMYAQTVNEILEELDIKT